MVSLNGETVNGKRTYNLPSLERDALAMHRVCGRCVQTARHAERNKRSEVLRSALRTYGRMRSIALHFAATQRSHKRGGMLSDRSLLMAARTGSTLKICGKHRQPYVYT